MHGPWAATGHTPFGKALRRFSVGPCHACRRGRVRRLLGLSKVGAGRLGTWRPRCCNTDRVIGRFLAMVCTSGAPGDRGRTDNAPSAFLRSRPILSAIPRARRQNRKHSPSAPIGGRASTAAALHDACELGCRTPASSEADISRGEVWLPTMCAIGHAFAPSL
jgi:hypothetical protein